MGQSVIIGVAIAVPNPRQDENLPPLRATGIDVLQSNLGKVCNPSCTHCHVDAGPDRRESMSRETAEAIIDVLAGNDIPTLDITGGAPEPITDFDAEKLAGRAIQTGRHCFGCTAGRGSSCQGSLVKP